MKGLLYISTILVAFFVGCQTMTPSTNNPLALEWMDEYNRLRDLPPSPTTCHGFKNLMEKDFPLKEFALLKGSLHCDEVFQPEESFPWLSEEWTIAKLKIAEKNNDREKRATLLLQRSKQIPLKEEQVKLVLEAQKISRNMDEAFQKQVEERLFSIAPRLNKNYKPKDSLKVARDFLSVRDFQTAKTIYLRVLNGKTFSLEEKMSAFKGLARLEKLSRDKEDHAEALRKYNSFLAGQLKKKQNKNTTKKLLKELKDNEIELARALWTVGKRAQAEEVLNKRLKEKQKIFSYAIHYWLLGRIEEEKKNSKTSLDYLRLSLKEVQDDPQLEAQARWFLAWNLFKLEEYAEAMENLKWFEEGSSEDFTKSRALYWMAVSQQKRNQSDEAQKTFQKLSRFDPLGYYGLLAKRELNETLQRPKADEQLSESYFFRIKLRKAYRPEWVLWMVGMNEKEALKHYLNQVTKDYQKSKNQDDEVWLHLLKSYARAGEYLGLFQKLYTLSPKTRDHLLNTHPELLFPTPHLKEILEASEKFQVEPELIYSIIRQESAFNPEARSPADAFGLMQLLPRVAEDIAKKIGLEINGYPDLYVPEKNIPLGTKLIADQRRRHKNNFISTVASYNASDQAIHGWRKTRERPSAIEFIEEIPYEETKGYIRLIIRNYAFYRLFLSSQKETVFPEEVLGTKEWLTGHQTLDTSDVSN